MCATTRPSTTVTLSTAGAPAATWRSAPAPVDPCRRMRSPSRAKSIGTTHGRPSTTVESVPASTSSSSASSSSRSARPRSGLPAEPLAGRARRVRPAYPGPGHTAAGHDPVVDAGWRSQASPTRVGRGMSAPPQVGQARSRCSAHPAQKVHSKEHTTAPPRPAGRSTSQHSHPGRISNPLTAPSSLVASDSRHASSGRADGPSPGPSSGPSPPHELAPPRSSGHRSEGPVSSVDAAHRPPRRGRPRRRATARRPCATASPTPSSPSCAPVGYAPATPCPRPVPWPPPSGSRAARSSPPTTSWPRRASS